MSKTVVGLFSTMTEANETKTTLTSEGFNHVSVVAQDGDHDTEKVGVGQKISNFFHGLAGGDEEAHTHYATGLNSGGALVTVTCDDDEAEGVAALLQQYGAKNIEGSYEEQAKSGTPVYGDGAMAASDAQAIPIVEEELVVGKREVNRGGVRVYSHVVSEPVSADVTLRDEYINVERRAVDRPATAADFAAGQGQVVELTATGEEAVVGKTSRVVEEVLVGKDTTSHTEAIHDSVRRTEVEVEEIPATAGTNKSNY
jgi:uncharacterized protein (TIGR02271 family)